MGNDAVSTGKVTDVSEDRMSSRSMTSKRGLLRSF